MPNKETNTCKTACRDIDPELFFPTTQAEKQLARKTCLTCPAILECARYTEELAVINNYPLQDIWNGINTGRENNRDNNETEHK